jgi:hypothetical protein
MLGFFGKSIIAPIGCFGAFFLNPSVVYRTALGFRGILRGTSPSLSVFFPVNLATLAGPAPHIAQEPSG